MYAIIVAIVRLSWNLCVPSLTCFASINSLCRGRRLNQRVPTTRIKWRLPMIHFSVFNGICNVWTKAVPRGSKGKQRMLQEEYLHSWIRRESRCSGSRPVAGGYRTSVDHTSPSWTRLGSWSNSRSNNSLVWMMFYVLLLVLYERLVEHSALLFDCTPFPNPHSRCYQDKRV